MRIRAVFALLIALVFQIPGAQANVVCDDFATNYQQALAGYIASTNKTGTNYKQLVELKKIADKIRDKCVKSINEEFKNALREINLKYSSSTGSKGQKLSAKTQKANEIAAATLQRDESMKSLLVLPALPDKPSNTGNRKKRP